MSNAANLQIPWYKRTNRQTLGDRIKSVQNVNDPTIVADDVQRWSTRFLYLLLIFTTLLSGFSYYKFFEKSFGVFAVFMAISLAATIEFGKNWGFLKVLRMPFFLGWKHIQSEVQETFMWVGLLLLSITTFAASVYNSTHGAHQLSLLLGNERNLSEFKPNTADIDNQIAATQGSMSQNRGIKWKGTVTYQAQKAIQKESVALEKLQNQRATTIDRQRADWEAQQAIKEGQNNFSANSLLAVGGFIELLQFLLMFMRVSAERSLDKTATSRNFEELSTATKGFTDFSTHGNGQNAPVNYGATNTTPMQFRWDGYGQTQNAPTAVTQHQPPVSQAAQHSPTVLGSNQILLQLRTKLMADIPNFRKRNGQPGTVSSRINKAFDECFYSINHAEFRPTREIGAKVYDYLVSDAIPALNSVGRPYERDRMFLKRLLAVIPKEHEQV